MKSFLSKKIFFSIILCCYNSEKYLLETLHGITDQTFKNFELIIIDDIYFKTEYQFLTDYIFFLDVSKKYDLHCSNKILTIWRSHSQQATKKLFFRYYQEMFKLYYNIILYENFSYKYKLIILKKYLRLKISYFLKIFFTK